MFDLKKVLLSLPGFESLCRLLTRRHTRVFMYHRFHEDNVSGEGLSASEFREQLCLITAHHTVWTTAQQLDARAGKAIPGVGPVVITVDDGYRDYYEVAYPILRDLGISATLFVTTGFVDGSIWMWWDQIKWVVDQAPSVAVDLEVSEKQVRLDLTSTEGRRAAVHFLVNRSRFIPDQEKRRVLERLATRLQVVIPEQAPAGMDALSWDQIREMHDNGQLFAPHTVNHPILSRITLEQVDQEIQGSRDRLAEVLGDAGQVFSYPQGGPSDYNEEISRRVAAAGFAASYLAYRQPRFEADAYQMPRYFPGGNLTAFRWALCGAEYIGNRLRGTLGLPISIGGGYWVGLKPDP